MISDQNDYPYERSTVDDEHRADHRVAAVPGPGRQGRPGHRRVQGAGRGRLPGPGGQRRRGRGQRPGHRGAGPRDRGHHRHRRPGRGDTRRRDRPGRGDQADRRGRPPAGPHRHPPAVRGRQGVPGADRPDDGRSVAGHPRLRPDLGVPHRVRGAARHDRARRRVDHHDGLGRRPARPAGPARPTPRRRPAW